MGLLSIGFQKILAMICFFARVTVFMSSIFSPHSFEQRFLDSMRVLELKIIHLLCFFGKFEIDADHFYLILKELENKS